MPHQDQSNSQTPVVAEALRYLVKPEIFGSLSFRSNCQWTPTLLVQAVLLWAWGEQTALTDRLATALQIISKLTGRQQEFEVSYQAFLKLLHRHSASLLFALTEALQRQMRETLTARFRVSGYLAFGVDGTCLNVPRTLSNEQAFAIQPDRRRRTVAKKAAAPRVWLTMLWHVGTGLPWGWLSGPRESSERGHLLEMLDWLPERSLLLADAGFVGYEFWNALREAGHDLLIRVGANVRLLTQLGYYREGKHHVYVWPDQAARKLRPPLVLRLVVAHNGKYPVYLVTSVLDARQLSDRQLIELYQARWGVEVFFRSFKRTFARHKLRSATSGNALLELDWSLAALWAGCLYAKQQQQLEGEDFTRTSVAGVLRILRRGLHETGWRLPQLLATALIDQYERRHKASRGYPMKKTDPPGTAPPKIQKATPTQITLAKLMKRLTA